MAYRELSEKSNKPLSVARSKNEMFSPKIDDLKTVNEELCKSTHFPKSYTPDLKLNHSKGAQSAVRRGTPNAFSAVRLRVHGNPRFGRGGFPSNLSNNASGRFGGHQGVQSSAKSSSQYFSDSGTSFKTGI